MFCVPSVSLTEMRLSPSSIFSARMPLLRMFFMASSLMRFMVPFLVTITM